MLCRPSMTAFEALVAVVQEGDWSSEGWKKSGIGYVWGGTTIQVTQLTINDRCTTCQTCSALRLHTEGVLVCVGDSMHDAWAAGAIALHIQYKHGLIRTYTAVLYCCAAHCVCQQQGLLAYYYRSAHPELGLATDRCKYNYMWDTEECQRYMHSSNNSGTAQAQCVNSSTSTSVEH
jgi:hypothetical protein